MGDLVGMTNWLIISALLVVITWGLVWFRLFVSGNLRPELSILSILPSVLYIYFMSVGEPMLQYYSEFFHLLAWGFAAVVLIVSTRPTAEEKKRQEGHDYAGTIVKFLCILYAIASWGASSYSLFPPNQQ